MSITFLFLIFTLIYAFDVNTPVPPMARFDYETINSFANFDGTLITDGSPFKLDALYGTGDMIVDQQNDQQRVCYTFTLPTTPPTVINECAWILPNATYVKGVSAHPGCLINRAFNYSQFVIGYTDARAQPGSTIPKGATYLGYISNDATTCGKAESVLLKVRNQVFTQYSLNGQILITVPTTNTTFCYHAATSLVFDYKKTIYPQNSNSFAPFFQLPTDCLSNPPNFCDYVPTCF